MDIMNYETLLNQTRASLSNVGLIGEVSFPSYFTGLLDDCRRCITISLDVAVNILLEANIQFSKLTQHMDDIVCLLQQLSALTKNIVESIPMSCCSFKTFPTTTGHIILLVFAHCKNSESVYGAHIHDVQKQLKNLFRTCHELQLTYLMVLEKHFIFDLTEEDQMNILLEALTINLRIGEVVQSLDVKTMAEQWKAYLALSEKYSSILKDKHTFMECTQLLCAMIENNIRNAVEAEQDEKVVMRSLKVTNFTIKILLKICSIFKHAPARDYSQIFDLLMYIYLHSPPYLELLECKPSYFVNAVSTNICSPSDLLLGELIMDDKFMNIVLSQAVNELKEEKLLGYVLLLVGIIKITVQKNVQPQSYPRHKLLHCIIRSLPECHIWLNIGIKFKNEMYLSKETIGLFEYMLIYAISLAITLSSEEMCHLEKNMYEAILSTESVAALFSSNLWTALARLCGNRHLLHSQVVSLCNIYQILESRSTFIRSPQRLHISHTVEALFRTMCHEDRLKVFKQFNPLDRRNGSLWSMLKIRNLPKNLHLKVQEDILERFKKFQSTVLTEESIYEMIQDMKLLGSCQFSAVDHIEDCLVQGWMRACPDSSLDSALSGTFDNGTLWYLDYVEALASWTSAVDHAFHDSSVNLFKVLHVISNIVKNENTELNLLLIDLLCNLATIPVTCVNKQSVDTLIKQSFKTLVQDNIVRSKLFRVVSTCDNKILEQTLASSISEDCRVMWSNYKSHRINDDYDITKIKEYLLETSGFKYIHKCLETRQEFEQHSEHVYQVQKTESSNFDFADLDTLFDNVSDSEPASKKIKIDSSEAESILNRLEADASLLCNVKENMFNSDHRIRIKGVCEKLKSIIT